MPAPLSRSEIGRIYIEKINYPTIYQDKATPAEYWAGMLARVPRKRDVREDAAVGQRPVRLAGTIW
ncbi:hypothetical protein BE61_26840 [Bradyrhizobium elkanii USDA 61]|jgi:hypothetical protein|nr:hypothetical protein BE61_26840 [Bradyrhizobium elkanii USDA 61]